MNETKVMVVAEGLPRRVAALEEVARLTSQRAEVGHEPTGRESRPSYKEAQKLRLSARRLKGLKDIDNSQLAEPAQRKLAPHPTDVLINQRGRLYVYWSDGSLRRATKKERK